ncbi:MAG TPA: PEGA domain-containing protein [Pyrinomonadaceae bacterium]
MLRTSVYIVTLILVGSCFTFAQGGRGGIAKPSTKTASGQETKSRTKKQAAPTVVKKSSSSGSGISNNRRKQPASSTENVKSPANGTLIVRVNQPGSEVFLSDQTGNVFEDRDFALTEVDGSLTIDELNSGSYVLTVRKAGFRDEQRQITLTGGKKTSVSVNLVAVAGILSINAAPSGTNIEIEGLGNFVGSRENLIVQPGKYRVYFNRSGYEPELREIAVERAGERVALDVVLKPLDVNKLLAAAQSHFIQKDFPAAFRAARQILAIQPENVSVNSLFADILFNSSRPGDSVPFYVRAISAGQSMLVPVKIYNKEKGAEVLVLGSLIFNQSTIQFSGAHRSDLNFNVALSEAGELSLETDSAGVIYVSFKARGLFGGKAERKTLRIYSRQAFVKAGGKSGLFCANASCKGETETIKQILERQIPGNFVRHQEKTFGAVMLPATNFVDHRKQNFSFSVPDNWEMLQSTDNLILVSPPGGYGYIQARVNFSHGVQVLITPSNNANLSAATEQFVNGLLTSNKGYSRIDSASEIQFPAGKGLLTKLRGFGQAQRDELVSVYTILMPSGDLFCLLTVVPPEESEDFQPAFRRILNSINFK